MPLLPPPYTPRKASAASSRSISNAHNGRSKSHDRTPSLTPAPPKKYYRFADTLASFRGNYQPELSRRLYRLIKTENYAINSYESAGNERQLVATQLSDWGEQTNDEAVSELSDKIGVLLSELGTQEHAFAQNLEDYRSVLKQIRNTEGTVQPSREHKAKIEHEIARLKYKDATSSRILMLEQELVRAEAENLVAEAQLTNVTRSKFKQAFAAHFAAVIERADKQTILARHGLRMLNLLDDTPVIPGDGAPVFDAEKEARQILIDAEEELKEWVLDISEEVTSNAHAVTGGVVDGVAAAASTISSPSFSPPPMQSSSALPLQTKSATPPTHLVHPAHRKTSSGSVLTCSMASHSSGGSGSSSNSSNSSNSNSNSSSSSSSSTSSSTSSSSSGSGSSRHRLVRFGGSQSPLSECDEDLARREEALIAYI